MDPKLLAWGLRRKPSVLPRLWLFTDQHRLPDPRELVARLPLGKAGVVLRHDHDPARLALGRDLARLCRQRRLILVVAGDTRLAAILGAGVHLRAGRWPTPQRPKPPRPINPSQYGAMLPGRHAMATSSAHSVADVRRARKSGASLVFLSPAFPTASHVGAPGLGPLRWAAMVRLANRNANRRTFAIAALGGVDGRSVRQLPVQLCQAIGAIGALSAS